MCSWSLDLMFKAKLKLVSRNWKFRYGCQVSIVKVTLLKINWCLSIHTSNLLRKFGLDIKSQTKVRVWKLKKPNMAARHPFWKWHIGKSIGFGPLAQTICMWNLKLKFHSKPDLRYRNHATYRMQLLKTPIWLPGGILKVTLLKIPYTQAMCQWSLDLIFRAKLKLEFGNRKIQYGCQMAILKVTLLKINSLLPIPTKNMHMILKIEISKQTWVTLWKPCHLQTDWWMDGQMNGQV